MEYFSPVLLDRSGPLDFATCMYGNGVSQWFGQSWQNLVLPLSNSPPPEYFPHFTFPQLWLPHTLYLSYSCQQNSRIYIIVWTALHSTDWACPQDKDHLKMRNSLSPYFLTSLSFQPALVNSPGSLIDCFSIYPEWIVVVWGRVVLEGDSQVY